VTARLHRLAPLAALLLAACSQAGADVAFLGPPPAAVEAPPVPTAGSTAPAREPAASDPARTDPAPTGPGDAPQAQRRPLATAPATSGPTVPSTVPATAVASRASGGGAPSTAAEDTAGRRSGSAGANGYALSCPPLPAPPSQAGAGPLVAALQARLADPRLAGAVVGASMWVDGYGEVLAQRADVPLVPASNQKLFTALGVLAVLPGDARLTTRVAATGPLVDGVVQGDLVLVGGGDPTLTSNYGPHSLTALGIQLLDAGVRGVTGRIVADETRYTTERDAPGWQPGDIPESSGPLSALVIDENTYRTDPEFLADPALGGADLFRQVLTGAGIAVGGPAATGRAPAGAEILASLASPTVDELVGSMLRNSDNEIAELLTREAGVASGGGGSTSAGIAALSGSLDPRCSGPAGTWLDGSGLSRDDRTSARALRRLVQAAAASPAAPVVLGGLPVAGQSGTLIHRFGGTPAEGQVRAKTGYLREAQALTGVLTTIGGRRAYFSVVVNGPAAGDSIAAIDDLVVTLAGDRS
jgi:D-alanyl-D-alanine carboxypeptidase/D-alanyl-D-alanine-endopeptidase (penicillin-binding protein 4)